MTEVRNGRARSDVVLILAAERLFAERGIAATSLREINQAANHRNTSAAHYHFGSREGLVRAVLLHRLPSLDDKSAALLRRQAASRDVRFYVSAFVLPFVEELQPRPEGNHFLRFVQQYAQTVPDYDAIIPYVPASATIYRAIEELIGYLPAAVCRLRIRYLITIIHSILASAEGKLQKGELSHADVPLTAANLIDMVVAALTAPLCPETIALLRPGAGQ